MAIFNRLHTVVCEKDQKIRQNTCVEKETTAEKSDISLFLGLLVNLRLKSV